ncbi:MAG TPA: TIGR00730 family Rossman fold protein [Gemmatimonadaceae bacterium]|nr:TIGR00730 family Rossman fold protein [Gemmatimonadaceae bacterium]
MLTTICVFCASSPGADPRYVEAARSFGGLLARSERRVVYGGGNTGLMGALAEGVLDGGGEIVGVMPRHLVEREVAHLGLSRLETVTSMHERKARLADLADAFVALPGGLGTLEEFTEIWTWGQLGLHRKPYGILNVAGYFAPLLTFLDHAVAQRFVRPEHRAMVHVAEEPAVLLEAMEHAPPPALPKWLDRATT